MNHRKIRRLGQALVTIALAGVCLAAEAQAPPAPDGQRMREPRRQRLGPGGEWWNNPNMVEALGLDERTRQLIEDEVHETRLRMIEMRGDVEREDLQLQRMLRDEPARSMREIEGQVDRFVSAQGRMMREEILLRARIHALLTPEQRAQLETMHQQRRDTVRREFLDRRAPGPPQEPGAPPPPPSPSPR